eukprot:GEMP01024585.1.p1 GENE.GEMP01024585.1~~GEMP01024585.1.p1  ORF type:complete len:419 (+),score=72.44 GEMP01024585.1:53-1258(+)
MPSKPVAAASEIILGTAALLGIDPINEPEYLWIAEQCSRAPIPEGWKEFVNEDKVTMYYHGTTKKLQKTHPLIDQYSSLFHKSKSYVKIFQQEQPKSKLDTDSTKLLVIITEILSRVTQGLSPTTPEIFSDLAGLLRINVTEDFFLCRCLKQTLEAYVEKQFNLGSIITDLKAPLDFLRAIRAKQVKVDIIKKPDHVTVCTECEEKSAVVKCEQCKDFFCQDCFNATHATGKRRAHITCDVEQLVCASCDNQVATSQCIQCGLFYCDQCFASTHGARPELHNHLQRVINGLVCLECEHYNASVLCEDCCDLYCTECFIKLHRKGKRRQHTHLTIDNTGQVYRGGFLVPPDEAQILTDRARSTAESGPWITFKDDLNVTYWYHLRDKISTRNDPYSNNANQP